MVIEEIPRSAGGAFRPSFQGYVETSQEAMIICEAYLQGTITCVSRCPSPTERLNFIRSGHVFVVKNSSGRKRWTDGMAWAPRVYTHDGFKVYHESKEGPKFSRQLGDLSPQSPPLIEQNRMIKKVFEVSIRGTPDFQVISYFTVKDVISRNLPTPSQDPFLRGIRVRHALLEIYAASLGGQSTSTDGKFNGRPHSPPAILAKERSHPHSPPTGSLSPMLQTKLLSRTQTFVSDNEVGVRKAERTPSRTSMPQPPMPPIAPEHQSMDISGMDQRPSQVVHQGIQHPAQSLHKITEQPHAPTPHADHDNPRAAHISMGPPPRVLHATLPGVPSLLRGVNTAVNRSPSTSVNPYIESSTIQHLISDDHGTKVFNQEDMERSKMLRNAPYNYFDPTLENERRRCAETIARYIRASNLYGGLREEAIHNILVKVFDPAQDTTHAFRSAPRVKGALGHGVKIEGPFTCRYGYNLHIMDNVHIERNCDIDDSGRVDIGRLVWIGPHVCILTSVPCNGLADDERSGAQRSARPVWIGPRVQIGARALICPGVRLEEGTVVEPGAIVRPNHFVS
ncbi:hypothetical protein LTR84_001279 [Exophiala bonariae]|uniref:Maltose/galactoside acetyltransferase domain-containing protein n=1 Tax=Exophiala bonariae TaxID=1690606 RepID=A0AAV9NTB7_9EURO|nr:hypothetical protein LTR84_001279 [Exophiala bonariae]